MWGITSVGWAVCLILIITGGMAAGHHDTVLSSADQNWPGRLLIFVAVWTVMVAAMMVPSTLPVARAFARVNAHQPRPTVTLLAFFGVYLTVWTGFAGVFVTGVGSLLWMVLLGVLMTAEKTFTHGKRWVAPIGIGLLIAAVLVSVPALARGIV